MKHRLLKYVISLSVISLTYTISACSQDTTTPNITGNSDISTSNGWRDASKVGMSGVLPGSSDNQGIGSKTTIKTNAQSNIATTNKNNDKSSLSNLYTHINMPEPVKPVTIYNSANHMASQLGESTKIDLARLAAESNDVCPKLITTQVDSNKIVREEEVMRDNHCDYIVYPKKGARITVQGRPNAVSALLISPYKHDFANGSYLVKSFDKYVIRLSRIYDEQMASPLNYAVEVTIE